MFIKWNKINIINLITLTILLIQSFIVISFGESNLNQEISQFKSKENITISDFKEFVKEQENKGYKIYILDLQEGFTSPKLIVDENINKVKELVDKNDNVSNETVNENTYPELFDQYEVEFLTCKDNKRFIFFIESNLINLVVKPSGDNIKVSVDGKLAVKVNEEPILLKKGNTYNVTIYENENEKLSKDVDLTNYEKDEYVLKSGGNILFIVIVMISIALSVTIFIYIRNKHRTNTKPMYGIEEKKKEKINNVDKKSKTKLVILKECNYIRIGDEIISANQLLKNEYYEDILRVQAIDKLETHIHDTEFRLELVRNNSFEILNNGYNLNSSIRKELNEIKGESDEIKSSLDKIEKDIDNLKKTVYEIKQYTDEKKLTKIKLSVDTAKDIFIRLEDCYLRLDEIKSKQYYIKSTLNTSITMQDSKIYNNQSYIDIVNNNAKILSELVKHVIKRDSQMDDFKELIEKEMKTMNTSINNVYSKMEEKVSSICESVRENNMTMKAALNNFDSNIAKTLNTEIGSINKQLQNIKYQSRNENNNINALTESLIESFSETIETKVNTIENIVSTLVDKVNVEYEDNHGLDLCKKYEKILDERSLEYLRTAEHLYYIDTNEKSMESYDYSYIYIMYSKLLELELSKCVDSNYLQKQSNKSLGSMIKWLRKNNSKNWCRFLESIDKENIRDLRNHSAHAQFSGDGIIKISNVNQIKDFLFDKSKTNSNICWLEFIIKQQK